MPIVQPLVAAFSLVFEVTALSGRESRSRRLRKFANAIT